MKHFEFRNFDYSNWERPEHTIISDSLKRKELFEKGYIIIPGFLNSSEIKNLLKIYTENHAIKQEEGGLFVSIYSKNLDYRRKINELLSTVLKKKFESVFQQNKLNSFNYIVKYPGKRSELFIHQDMALVDEFNYSEVGIWLPLTDVTLKNGTIGLVPFSHFLIPPHRSLHHELPFSKIYPLVFNYMMPLEIKAGDLLLYDPRLLHNSFVNQSDAPRIVIASRATSAEATFCICYKDSGSIGDDYELLEVDDDFFLKFDDFKSDKVKRPSDKPGKKVKIKEAFVEADDFLGFCKTYDLPTFDTISELDSHATFSIQEPVSKTSGFKTFFKNFSFGK